MLSDRINTILESMDITISDVARAGGCTPSNLNRVKNGVRTPPPESPTIRYLTDGLISIAEQRHLIGELMRNCGAELKDSREELRSKLILWLYEDEPPYVRSYKKREEPAPCENGKQPPSEFSARLCRLLDAAGISNRRLGREAGMDPSYISRLRRGERVPKYQSPYLIAMCRMIISDMTEDGKTDELSELTSLTPAELKEKDGPDSLRRWLFGYGAVTGYMAADELMDTISSIDDIVKRAKERASESSAEGFVDNYAETGMEAALRDEERYVGTEGLRAAVTRFLSGMIRSRGRELLLYSDQSMDWMEGEYRKTLTALMTELIRRGVNIRAIHTVNRSLSEIVTAISWWMPLYLSGKVTSYYCMPSAGRRFSHTLFIRPGEACIAGTSVVGLEERAIYHYSSSGEETELAEESFSSLMEDSVPLVEISECAEDDPECEGYVETDSVRVRADKDQVIIRRIMPPYLMFRFTHPVIVRAFRAYMKG